MSIIEGIKNQNPPTLLGAAVKRRIARELKNQ